MRRWNSKENEGILEICPEIMTNIRYGGMQGEDDDNEAVIILFIIQSISLIVKFDKFNSEFLK